MAAPPVAPVPPAQSPTAAAKILIYPNTMMTAERVQKIKETALHILWEMLIAKFVFAESLGTHLALCLEQGLP